MKNKVKIMISGPVGCGKTLIRELLEEKLLELGAHIRTNGDQDYHTPEDLKKLKNSKVFKDTLVIIETKQTNKINIDKEDKDKFRYNGFLQDLHTRKIIGRLVVE